MAHIEVKGFRATIRPHERMKDSLTEEMLQEMKDSFDNDEVDEDTIYQLLYRSASDRQRIISYFDIAERLSAEEDDSETITDIIKCLGTFPLYEKLFLMNILSSTYPAEKKLLFLAETIFSKTTEVLDDFRAANSDLNQKIVDVLQNPSEGVSQPNCHVTKAVEAVLLGRVTDLENIFPQSVEMYEIKDGGDEDWNLKNIYEQCRCENKIYLPRRLFLKKLLLRADASSEVTMVTKIILSHCDFDLYSILAEVRGDDTKGIADNLVQKIVRLSTLEGIKSQHLRDLVRTAAFGVEE